jgi:transcriptional regulator with XRE-family HTH domain
VEAQDPLKLLRDTLGLTQVQLAKRLKVSPGRISQVEQVAGERLGTNTILRMMELYRVEIARLGLTVEDFMRGNGRAA